MEWKEWKENEGMEMDARIDLTERRCSKSQGTICQN